MNEPLELSVSEFVSVLNQTLEYAYSSVVIHGELANFRISRNRWVYFDLKDDQAKVAFFGTVQQIPGPLEDGMLLKVRGQPRLHPQYGFSVNISNIVPSGYGTIKRVADLLKAQLAKEGLFDAERKRPLPYIPAKIGLITSVQSAAYIDFIKIIDQRWGGLVIQCVDVAVQGDQAPSQIMEAIAYFNGLAQPPDVLVITRGGGSPEDLAAFDHEQLTRSIAASRIPTLVAVGHERDISLAELAADKRASTPSNAAEVLVPDRQYLLTYLNNLPLAWKSTIEHKLSAVEEQLKERKKSLLDATRHLFDGANTKLVTQRQLLALLDPSQILQRGYAIVRHNGRVTSGKDIKIGSIVDIEMAAASFSAEINNISRLSKDGKS